jgi:outer membrane beta-barrel protein
LAASAAIAAAALSPAAYAQDDGDDAADGAAADAPAGDAAAPSDGGEFLRIEEREPREGTPLIANKLYPMAGRFEFGLNFDASFGDKYVDHIGGHATVGYHLFDFLSFEGFGGYLRGDETGIVANVRQDGKSAGLRGQSASCANDLCEPQLPDMYQTTWFAGANVQWAPIYGKLSAVSEYDLNFQFYARLGGGVEGIQRLLNDQSYGDVGVRPSLNSGLGVRLIPWKYIAIRAELVNYSGLNPNVQEHDSTDEGSCGDGYVLRNGNDSSCLTDFSSTTMVQLGISFML